jgi:hypothetical protein
VTRWDSLMSVFGPPGRPLPRQTAAQLVGRPRDGELYPTAQRHVRFMEEAMPIATYVPEAEIPMLADEPKVREYTLQKWVACMDAAPILVFVCDDHKLPGAP